MYGAGKIVALRSHNGMSEDNEYYVVYIPAKRLQVMVPIDKAEEVGLRLVSDEDVFDQVWSKLRRESRELNDNWKKRKKNISDNLKSGDILKIAEDIAALTDLREERKLSYTDRTLLEKGKHRVASELALAKDLDEEEALKLITSCLEKNR
jgi:CarD family transcriptional regulator